MNKNKKVNIHVPIPAPSKTFIQKYFPTVFLGIGALFVASTIVLEKSDSKYEPIEWPVVNVEVEKSITKEPIEVREVLEATEKVTEGKTEPSPIEWPVVREAVSEVEEVMAPTIEEIKPTEEAISLEEFTEAEEIEVREMKDVKEKQRIRSRKVIKEKKIKRSIKMTSSHEDFIINLTRGMI